MFHGAGLEFLDTEHLFFEGLPGRRKLGPQSLHFLTKDHSITQSFYKGPGLITQLNRFSFLQLIYPVAEQCNVFKNYNLLCYYSCPDFSPFAPSTQHPSLPQAITPDCSCPWVMCINSLSTQFPILYSTSQWLFCNCPFLLLSHLTSSPIVSHHPPIWQPPNCCPYP